ncbi:MAG TPA: chemotaxis protein CheB [Steroidobacteraceae bacterium]|nr:chemotaxis protein CheB [Steroidobacteraceae bacterium]
MIAPGAIVMGGSLGGMQAAQTILQALPADFAMPIVIALHRPRDDEDMLTPLLQRGCALRVSEVTDKEPIEAGRVYVAPADYHVLIEHDCLSLSVDERVHHARPSIDVLFESAALVYGRRAIGVILSGAGVDGARGAAAIHEAGGTVLIESPATALRSDLPAAAIAATAVSMTLPLPQVATALRELARKSVTGVTDAT